MKQLDKRIDTERILKGRIKCPVCGQGAPSRGFCPKCNCLTDCRTKSTSSSTVGDSGASEGQRESCNIIVEDCDTCVLHRLGDGYEQITKCAIEKSADTSRCTFGNIPENCPLIKNDIIFKLKKGAIIMSPTEGQEE